MDCHVSRPRSEDPAEPQTDDAPARSPRAAHRPQRHHLACGRHGGGGQQRHELDGRLHRPPVRADGRRRGRRGPGRRRHLQAHGRDGSDGQLRACQRRGALRRIPRRRRRLGQPRLGDPRRHALGRPERRRRPQLGKPRRQQLPRRPHCGRGRHGGPRRLHDPRRQCQRGADVPPRSGRRDLQRRQRRDAPQSDGDRQPGRILRRRRARVQLRRHDHRLHVHRQ